MEMDKQTTTKKKILQYVHFIQLPSGGSTSHLPGTVLDVGTQGGSQTGLKNKIKWIEGKKIKSSICPFHSFLVYAFWTPSPCRTPPAMGTQKWVIHPGGSQKTKGYRTEI